MMHPLKIYSIYNISTLLVEIDYDAIPKDLHDLTKDFIKFFKIGKDKLWFKYICNSNDLITDFNNKKDDLLILSSKYEVIEVVRYLVENGANIHTNDDYPLRWAACNGHLEIVKYLHQNGADIRVVNDEAIRTAAHNDHPDVVKYLYKNGADIHAKNDEALKWVVDYGHLEIVEYFNSLK